MKRRLIQLAILICVASSSQAVDGSLTATMSEEKDSSPPMLCGPITLKLMVANSSDRDVNILWNYPDIPGVNFQITGTAGPAAFQSPDGDVNMHLGSTTIKAHSDYHVPIYVARYWRFSQAGTADIVWTFDMTEITEKSQLVTTRFSGMLSLQIVDINPTVVAQILTRDQNRMQAGRDAAMREWALQEIFSINHPLAIPYLERMATDAGREYSAVQSLLRFYENPEARVALRTMLLKTNEVTTVEAILGGYYQNERMLSDSDMTSLLSSSNAAIRSAVLADLERLLSHLPISRVRELEKDKDQNVSQSAREILKRLKNRADGLPLDTEARPVEDPHASKF